MNDEIIENIRELARENFVLKLLLRATRPDCESAFRAALKSSGVRTLFKNSIDADNVLFMHRIREEIARELAKPNRAEW